MRQRTGKAKPGFTLIELLVSMALIVFIMAILAQAFEAATQTLRALKAEGDMAERLRSASQMLRRDLGAYHFDGQRKMSDADFWVLDKTQPQGSPKRYSPPLQGFFRLWQSIGSPPISEGMDLDGNPSYRTAGEMLHFTVKLTGLQRKDFFSAYAPGLPTIGRPDSRYQDTASTYNSQTAEVVYFLVPTGDSANGTPLYSLYRRQLLTVPDNALVTTANGGNPVPFATYPNNNSYFEMSCKLDPSSTTPQLYFNNLTDLTMPARRFGMDGTNPTTNPNAYAGIFPNGTYMYYPRTPTYRPPAAWWGTYPRAGDQYPSYVNSDLILTDVVSFDVRLLLGDTVAATPPTPTFEDLSTITARYPAHNTLFGPKSTWYIFDTWSSNVDATYNYSGWQSATPGTNTIPIWSKTTYPPATDNDLISVRAIQITIRIWDPKTQLSRQATVVQDL